MYVPRTPDLQSRTASLPPSGPPSLPPSSVLFTAQEAEESIEFIQRELSRLLRACEYREKHPYDILKRREDDNLGEAVARSVGGSNGASSRITSASASHRRGSTAPLLSDAEPSLKVGQLSTTSSFPFGLHRSDAAESALFSGAEIGADANATVTAANLSAASFSTFERRRIAHLLGRVALEIAAVWTYVRQGEPLRGASPTDVPTLTSSLPTTARGTAQLSSDRSTAAPAVSPSTPASSTVDGGDGRAIAAAHLNNAEADVTTPAVMRCSVWGETPKKDQDAYGGGPAAKITALRELIATAAAIQRFLGVAGGGGGGESAGTEGAAAAVGSVRVKTPLEVAQVTSLTFSSSSFGDVTECIPEAAGVFVGTQSCRDSAGVDASSVVTAASPGFPSALSRGRTAAPEDAEQHSSEGDTTILATSDSTAACRVRSGGSRVKQGSATASSIPFYLRAYVFKDGTGGCDDEIGNSSEGRGIHGNEGEATVLKCADKGVSRSSSAGSELLVTSHDDSYQTRPSSVRSVIEHVARGSHLSAAATGTKPSLHGSAATSLTAPTYVGGSGGAATVVEALLDADTVSHNSSLRIQRVLSASSLRSASLMSSPLQEPQFSTQRPQGYSGGSASSQPNASVSQRSPDSAEMSPAAATAYLRSASLFRRPHRLEVPVSRTHSLRRAPSIPSPVSVEGINLGSAPEVTQHSGTLKTAPGAHGNSSAALSHLAKTTGGPHLSSGGVGTLRTSSCFASFPPVAMGASTTADSPHSSVAGLHFKRVISLDSEGGLWPQGSFADSLEASQQKVAVLQGWASGSTMEATLLSSPLSQGVGLVTVTGSHGDSYGALTSPSEGQCGGVMPVATSFSDHRSSVLPPGRAELSQSHCGAPNPTVSRASAVTMPSAVLGCSYSRPRPAALLSPAHFSLSYQSRPNDAVTMPTAFAPAPTAAGDSFAADGLIPYSYRIEEEILTEFLRCVHDLTRANLTDAEFDSLQLYYFLPGVSLVTPVVTAQSLSSSLPPLAPPLPLFKGGELVPLRRGSLDVFCSLIRERLAAVCHNLRISSAPYLALL
ncbi:conserved hypothetical protein [Leishmania braziliensis MHOM/BR/75/M2904]|uniref:Uncharacterized protein n=2 Tax=Leishmania braziliensis TaxID=5660 RepID=A4HHB8_LEIBR|nr:conserved hypothetical protein [Leishmania braziliensis MHOM/BR/75/M2904]CAJ2476480.1 unnamed protein product [Leishmania braziliensis]CAM39970.1 conserved hypothetical protein [Leishmania braziliensis MHOM/BR/75/M2904]SYZ67633.1 hypothetical_protein [Leishmania braziliensis MHOM/BR/75/M2904]